MSLPPAASQGRPRARTFNIAHEPARAPGGAGQIRARNQEGAVILAPGDGEGMAGSWPVRQFVQHPQIDGEPLMDPESTGEVRSALAAFPGLADVAVLEHDAGQAGQCLIAYVVPSGPGLDVPELHAHAPATPRQEILCELFAEVLGVSRCGTGNDFFDLGGRSIEAMVLAGRISTALGIRISMADLFKASTAGDMDRRLSLMADTRK
jgi:acyl carrier protein